LRRTDLVVDSVGEGSFAAAFPPGRFPEAFPVGLRRGLREATGQVMSISRKMAFRATAGFQIRASVAAVSDRRKRDQQRPAVRDRRYRNRTYPARSASTGFTKLARLAGNKQASNAARARMTSVAPSRSGLCAEV